MMPWTERYFETQYLIMVIGCCLGLLLGVICFGAWVFKKISNAIYKRQLKAEKVLARLEKEYEEDKRNGVL